MDQQDTTEQAQELLALYRRTLAYCLHEQAKFATGYVPPNMAQSLAEARVNIEQLKHVLRAQGRIVADWPHDAAPAASVDCMADGPGDGAPLRSQQRLAELQLLAQPDGPLLDAGVPTDGGERSLDPPGEADRSAPLAQAAPPAPAPLAEAARPVAGSLPHYQLLEPIAGDEQITVYRASQRSLGRGVHVHVLRATDEPAVSRFLAGARRAMRLNHPNLVPVLDAGRDEQVGAYLVTPQIVARSLQDILAGGLCDPILSLRIFAQIGAALDALHAQGLIHGAIGPEHILVTPQGTAYLTHLHQAQTFGTADQPDPLEAEGQAADETADPPGATEMPGPASDLASLAVLLERMLRASSLDGIEQTSETMRDGETTLAGVDRIVQTLRAPGPAQCYASASEAVAALRQALPQQIVELADYLHESRWETVARWLENPLEGLLGDLLADEFLTQSRARADALHRIGAAQHFLNGRRVHGLLQRLRRLQLDKLDRIVSYNLYFYELRVHYETRSAPQTRQRASIADLPIPDRRTPDLWTVPVPYVEPFMDVLPERCMAAYSCPCETCRGTTQVVCASCVGAGVLTRSHWITYHDGTTRLVSIEEGCAVCGASGWLRCVRCAGASQVVQEQTFIWARRGRVYFNEDDLSGIHVHRRAIERHAQQVYRSTIDPYDPRWYHTAPLQELLTAAVGGGGSDSRPIAAELIIRGVPITEIDYQHRQQAHNLVLIGFANEIR
jgi:eukaryotic-like serine/threonine-protein kinase